MKGTHICNINILITEDRLNIRTWKTIRRIRDDGMVCLNRLLEIIYFNRISSLLVISIHKKLSGFSMVNRMSVSLNKHNPKALLAI